MVSLYPIDEVSSLLQKLGALLLPPKAPELPQQLRTAQGRAYLIPVTWRNTSQAILFLPIEFPDERPLVYLPAPAIPKRVFPHINREGQICTLPIGTVVNPFRPADQVMTVLQNAQKVIQRQYSSEEELAEVEQELIAYWGGGEPILLLTDNTIETHRVVNVQFSEVMTTATKKRIHLVARMPERIPSDIQIGLVLEVQREKLIDFLNDPAKAMCDDVSWKESCALLAHMLSRRNNAQKAITVFMFARCKTHQGPVWLGGCFLDPFIVRKSPDQNESGLASLPLRSRFCRCGMDSLRTERLLRRVEGQSANAYLMEKSVTVVGCGSIGSFMADMLSRSGVQRMLVLDKETLESANLPRHLLDVSALFLSKADQLRLRLVHRFPEGEFVAHIGDARKPEGIKSIADFGSALNVVATGDTNTDMTISEFCRLGRIGACCFVWVEAGLQAGHIVYQPGGCSNTLVDLHGPEGDGRFLYRYRLLMDPEQGRCQEPACQFTFTPYSATDAVLFATAATRKVIEWLKEPPQEMRILRWRIDSANNWEVLNPAG
jgi:hypothetical protein